MSRSDPQLRIRLSEDLKEKIAISAKINNRSINAEIVTRLTVSFDIENDNSSTQAALALLDESKVLDAFTKRLLDTEIPKYISFITKEILSDEYIEELCAKSRLHIDNKLLNINNVEK